MKKHSGKKADLRKVQPAVAQIGGSDYGRLLTEIKDRVRVAQYEALRAVNKELVTLYWDIGRMIVERQATGLHGEAVVKQLAQDLQREFPGLRGLSWRNLFYMSEFFLAYRDHPKLQPMAAIIAWTHNLVIMQRCRDPLEREFYIRMTRKFGWSKNVLIHRSRTGPTKRLYWARPISTRRSHRRSARRPSWRSKMNTPLTFWSWAKNTRNENWNGPWSLGSPVSPTTGYRLPFNREPPTAAFGRNQNPLAQRRGGAEISRQERNFPPCVPASLRETEFFGL